MPGPATPEGLFCSHKKLRTTCPECRPPPPPKREKPRAAPRRKPSSGDAAETGEPRKRRIRIRPPTREEADRAEAWWVKDR